MIAISTNAIASNTERYCGSISELATGYVEDRNSGWTYAKSLSVAMIAVEQANLTKAEKLKFQRDIRASVKIAYIDFPQITTEGIYKLVKLGCNSE